MPRKGDMQPSEGDECSTSEGVKHKRMKVCTDGSGSDEGGMEVKTPPATGDGKDKEATAATASAETSTAASAETSTSSRPAAESSYLAVRAPELARPILSEKKSSRADRQSGGNVIRLDTNFVKFGQPDMKAEIFLYEVVIEPHLDNPASLKNLQKAGSDDAIKNLRRTTCFDVVTKVIRQNQELFDGMAPQAFAYDRSRILFSTKKLSNVAVNKSIVIERHETSKKGAYKVVVRENKKIGVGSMTLERLLADYRNRDLSEHRDCGLQQFVEVATSQAQFRSDRIVSATNGIYYNKEESPESLQQTGAYVARGFSKSAKIAEAGILLCVEPRVTSMFKSQSVIALLQEVGTMGNPRGYQLTRRDISLMTNQLRGLCLSMPLQQTTLRQLTFTCAGVTTLPAMDCEFTYRDRESGDERQLTVAEYFAQIKKDPLQFPNLPCAVERRPGPPGGRPQTSFYPLEKLTVAKYQRVQVKQQSKNMQQVMIRKSAVHADIRKKATQQIVQHELQLTKSLLLETLHLRVVEECVSLEGRVLGKVSMEYAKGRTITAGGRLPGKWSLDRNQFYYAAPVDKWAILTVAIDRRDFQRVGEFERRWMTVCREHGMDVGQCVTRESAPNCEMGTLERIFKRMHEMNVKFVICLVLAGDESKPNIKYLESKYGIITQCVTKRLIAGPRPLGADSLQNIVNKTNMKLGGLNAILSRNDQVVKMYLADDVMYIAYDVSKPPPLTNSQRRAGVMDTEPSVVGMAATTQKRKEVATIDFTLQPGRHEEVVGLEKLMKTMLQRFKNAHDGALPRRYIVFRDGVSEGEYTMVLSNEVPRLQRAINEVSQGTDYEDYKLTMVVCTKRHDARFFLQNIDQRAKPSMKNIPPGTCVDSVVTSVALTEYYLCSHAAFQGTAKAIKYSVLYDTAHIPLEILQSITWLLSHCHGIITQTVSKPFMVMAAMVAAQRGRQLYMTHTQSCDASSRASTSSGEGRLALEELVELTNRLKMNGNSAERQRCFTENAYYA